MKRGKPVRPSLRLAALALGLCLLLSGCRMRTGWPESGSEVALPENAEAGSAGPEVPGTAGESPEGSGMQEVPGAAEESPEGAQESIEDARKSPEGAQENPEASRKEYDENAEAEIQPEAALPLHTAGEGPGLGREDPEAPEAVPQIREDAEERGRLTVTAEDAEKLGIAEEAAAADSALTYYTVLLEEKIGSLFECQRANCYLETEADHVTCQKTDPEHALILGAGCYDVSARLLPENLRVDDGWVVRKNPQIIAKIIGSEVLGSGVAGTSAARNLCVALTGREGWASTDAVRSRRILLLSRELLDAPYPRVAAMLLIAKAAYPDLFSDMDPALALRMLCEEASGTVPSGTLYYLYGEE